MTGYWRAARAPRYSLTFAFPLLLAYEALAIALSGDEIAGVRNGADVILKSLFVTLGGRNGLLLFGALLVGSGAVLVWRDLRRSGGLEGRVFLLMALESVSPARVPSPWAWSRGPSRGCFWDWAPCCRRGARR